MACLKPEDQKRIERLICTVCFDVFCDPKLLPCHHTFCLACLQSLVASSPQKSSFRCPNCRAQVSVPSGGLSTFQNNFYLLPEELEAARQAINEVSSGSQAPGSGIAYSQQRQATRNSAPTERGTAAQANVCDTNSDWLIACHLTEEETMMLSDDSSRAVFSAVGSPRESREEEEGEFNRAVQESLETYKDELERQRGQERRPATEQPQDLRGLQTAVASEALRRWSQRRQSGDPSEQGPRSLERPGSRGQHGVPVERPRAVDEIVGLGQNEREEGDEQGYERQPGQHSEHLQELQRKFNEILTRRIDQGDERRQEGEHLAERQRRPEQQTGQEAQSELQQVFQRLGSRRGEDRAPKRPCGEQRTQIQLAQVEQRKQDQTTQGEQRTEDQATQGEQRTEDQATQGEQRTEDQATQAEHRAQDQTTQGEQRTQDQATQAEHRAQDKSAQGELEEPRIQGSQIKRGRQWECRPSGQAVEQRPHQHHQDQQRESSPRRELAQVFLRHQSKQGEPKHQPQERYSEPKPQAPVAADSIRRRQTRLGVEGGLGPLQKELAQVLGRRHTQQ